MKNLQSQPIFQYNDQNDQLKTPKKKLNFSKNGKNQLKKQTSILENSQTSLYHNTEDYTDYFNQKSLSKSFATFNHPLSTDCLRK